MCLTSAGIWGQPHNTLKEILLFYCRTTSASTALAHLEGCAALRIVLVTVPRVSRSCEHFPDGFDLHTYKPIIEADMRRIFLGMVSRTTLGSAGTDSPLRNHAPDAEDVRNHRS